MGWEELARRVIEEIDRAVERIDEPEDRRKFLTEVDEAVTNMQAERAFYAE